MNHNMINIIIEYGYILLENTHMKESIMDIQKVKNYIKKIIILYEFLFLRRLKSTKSLYFFAKFIPNCENYKRDFKSYE